LGSNLDLNQVGTVLEGVDGDGISVPIIKRMARNKRDLISKRFGLVEDLLLKKRYKYHINYVIGFILGWRTAFNFP
jgi:hypothetical protein